jgi:hypothetical protein
MLRKTKRRSSSQQRGGVGWTPNVSKPKIGGLPEIDATSDCPPVGPTSPKFALSLYGGSKRKTTKRRRSTKSRRSTKRRSNTKRR